MYVYIVALLEKSESEVRAKNQDSSSMNCWLVLLLWVGFALLCVFASRLFSFPFFPLDIYTDIIIMYVYEWVFYFVWSQVTGKQQTKTIGSEQLQTKEISEIK